MGRLDFHSEGLILLTNDGDLAFKVAHPSTGSVKVYSVKVRGVPEERIIDKLRRGITIEGKRTLPCEIERMKTTGPRTRAETAGSGWGCAKDARNRFARCSRQSAIRSRS